MSGTTTVTVPRRDGPVRNGADPSRMQCMQVWGGSEATELSVSTTGLDVWLYSKPYGNDHAGGDVHFVSSCSSGRITRLALADVRGHGHTVVHLAQRLRRLMQRHINRVDQHSLVSSINQELAADDDPSTFATGLIATFFVPTGTLAVSNAGHPAPLLRRGDGVWRSLEQPAPARVAPCDVPLGIFTEARYSQRRLPLTTDDVLLCFTDAVEECVDERGAPLGRAGLLKVMAELGAVPPAELIPEVVRALTTMAASNLNEDDATILVVRPNGASVPLKDNLLAPFRYLSGVARGS